MTAEPLLCIASPYWHSGNLSQVIEFPVKDWAAHFHLPLLPPGMKSGGKKENMKWKLFKRRLAISTVLMNPVALSDQEARANYEQNVSVLLPLCTENTHTLIFLSFFSKTQQQRANHQRIASRNWINKNSSASEDGKMTTSPCTVLWLPLIYPKPKSKL